MPQQNPKNTLFLYPHSCDAIDMRRLCGGLALSLLLLLEIVVGNVGDETNGDNNGVCVQAGAGWIRLAASLVRVGDLALGALVTRL